MALGRDARGRFSSRSGVRGQDRGTRREKSSSEGVAIARRHRALPEPGQALDPQDRPCGVEAGKGGGPLPDPCWDQRNGGQAWDVAGSQFRPIHIHCATCRVDRPAGPKFSRPRWLCSGHDRHRRSRTLVGGRDRRCSVLAPGTSLAAGERETSVLWLAVRTRLRHSKVIGGLLGPGKSTLLVFDPGQDLRGARAFALARPGTGDSGRIKCLAWFG